MWTGRERERRKLCPRHQHIIISGLRDVSLDGSAYVKFMDMPLLQFAVVVYP